MTHDPVRDYRKSMKIALFITLVFFLVEVDGGMLSGSLTLISDVLSLVLSLEAMTLTLQLPTKERTYGYHRGEIFTAFINSLLLIAVSAGILWHTSVHSTRPRCRED